MRSDYAMFSDEANASVAHHVDLFDYTTIHCESDVLDAVFYVAGIVYDEGHEEVMDTMVRDILYMTLATRAGIHDDDGNDAFRAAIGIAPVAQAPAQSGHPQEDKEFGQ